MNTEEILLEYSRLKGENNKLRIGLEDFEIRLEKYNLIPARKVIEILHECLGEEE